MPDTRRRISTWGKVGIGALLFIALLIIGFHIFITRYLPGVIKQRLENVIVNGSDSLYKFEMGKIIPGFWGNSFQYSDLHIYIDSAKYRQLKNEKRLPGLTFDLELKRGKIEDIGLRELLMRKKLDIKLIDFTEATILLSRHYRTTANNTDNNIPDEPLWKSIQPNLLSISVRKVLFRDINIKYNNVDSATAFSWQFEHCNVSFENLQVDSLSSRDSNRLLFSKNITLNARDVKLKTPDSLYTIKASSIFYSSLGNVMGVKQFKFEQAVDNSEFIKHFGQQHEIYTLSVPSIQFVNFDLPKWITYNQLNIDTVNLQSPDISIYLDRNAHANTKSKLGKYPQQLLLKAPFIINIKRVKAINGILTYREKNRETQLTGTLVFPAIRANIDHITNDSSVIAHAHECIADINSGVLRTGSLHAIFKFNLTDQSGGFNVSASIANLNAQQMQSLIKAMTSATIQSFNMRRLDYEITGNESVATGQLRMKYDDMDISLNKINDDGSTDKKKLLSFLVNQFVIYKENPTTNGDERIAENVQMKRDPYKSFFNFIWKTMYASAAKIILRPVTQRKIAKRKEKEKQKG